jgi:PRTRC genetic system protein B
MVTIAKDVDVSDPVRGVPVAERAYVFYDNGSGYCAATEHLVRNGKLGLGKVVSMRSIGDRFARITGNDRPILLPENVVVSGGSKFAWYTKARRDDMWFNVNGRRFACRVWWPNLLWIASKSNRQLRIFALGRGSRPTAESTVYHAPLMNIGGGGHLCEGSARLPRRIDEEHIAEIEACVYESNFTHVNHDQTIRRAKTNKDHIAYWRRVEKEKRRVRVSDLVKIGKLGDIL